MKIDYDKVYYAFRKRLDVRTTRSIKSILYSTIKYLYFNDKDDPGISDIIENHAYIFRRRINEEILNYNKFKDYLRFEWSIEDEDLLIGCACKLLSDTPEEREYKRKLGNAFLLEDILEHLDDSNFEELCAKILKEIGCKFTGKTRVSADGGIDFWGTLIVNDSGLNQFPKQFKIVPNAKIHFIGQAKRYSGLNVIRPEHVREFLGSALLLEFVQGWNIQDELSIKNLPPRYLKPKDPCALVFLTTSTASKNARKLAKSLGIHLQDGEDISRWLSFNPLANIEQDISLLSYELKNWIFT